MDREAVGGLNMISRLTWMVVVILVGLTLAWGWGRIPSGGILIRFDVPAPPSVYADDGTSGAPASVAPLVGLAVAPVVKAAVLPRSPVRPTAVRTKPTPAAVARSNWIADGAVGLGVQVGHYTDCSGTRALPRDQAQIFDCAAPGVLAILGHNPGVFTPLVRARLGERVDYWDGEGHRLAFTINEVHRVNLTETWTYIQDGSRPHLVLVTCALPDGSVDWIMVAEPIPAYPSG